MIHRDIKPENILLADGEPIVADFGIARAVTAAGGQPLTETGMALGTASYMSPEQALGESDLDARTDIYSLGCVLYEMLAGQPPYTGVSAQAIVARRLSEPVPPLRTIRELVPETVQLAVEKALARMPADRYSNAQAFAAALTAPLGAMSPDSVTAVMEQNRRVSPTRALAWAYFQRDTTLLSRLAAEAPGVASSPANARAAARAQYQKGTAAAYLTLVRGDSAAGLRALQAMPDSLCQVLALVDTCFFHKLTLARLLVAQGDDRGAATVLDQSRWAYLPLYVLATLERARIAERLGERSLAVESYQLVVDFWRRADPELHPYVREAQDGLARLTGEP